MLSAAIFLAILNTVFSQSISLEECYKLNRYGITLHDVNRMQPIFLNLLPDSEENRLIDNICITFFPLTDDCDTFQIYTATVFCNGSFAVSSNIGTVAGVGATNLGNPKCMALDVAFGGVTCCNTFISIRCPIYGDCSTGSGPYIFGESSEYTPLGDSCVQRVVQVIQENGLPPQQYIALPMKLPNQCVTQQVCSIQQI